MLINRLDNLAYTTYFQEKSIFSSLNLNGDIEGY